MRVGESVRQAREKLGLSTLDVARHIPMDERYIIQIELASVGHFCETCMSAKDIEVIIEDKNK